jgi:hypothetical protein
VFIGGVIVVIDVASWKAPSLLHSNYRLPEPATDNVPPLPRKRTFAKIMRDMDHPIRRPEDYPPPSIFETPESRPADKVSVSGSVKVPRETFRGPRVKGSSFASKNFRRAVWS